MTSKFVATALLAALVATGCGASAEEKEATCWTTRNAIFDEIEAAEAMKFYDLMATYEDRVPFIVVDQGEYSTADQNNRTIYRHFVWEYLSDRLPDC